MTFNSCIYLSITVAYRWLWRCLNISYRWLSILIIRLLGVTAILKIHFSKPAKSNKLISMDFIMPQWLLWLVGYIFVMNADNMTWTGCDLFLLTYNFSTEKLSMPWFKSLVFWERLSFKGDLSDCQFSLILSGNTAPSRANLRYNNNLLKCVLIED